MTDPVLERSVLERKERDELLTIAKALGAKPPARAKKADIVELILTSTGVTGGAPEPEPEAEAPAEAPPARAERIARPTTRSGDRSAPEATRSGPQKSDDASVNEPVDEAPAESPSSEAHEASDAPEGNHAGSGDRDDQERDEFGNRRRRRRGRDRERGGNDFPRNDDQWTGEPVECAGLLDLRDEGYGFLRTKGFLPSKDDVYVSVKQVRQFGLRKGDHVAGASRPANRTEKNPALLRIDLVNEKDPEQTRHRPRFDDLTPLFPDERLKLEDGRDTGDLTARIVDLVSPIGKGQRGLIVSPPKAGKTTIVKTIVQSIERNNPEVHLIVLLVDERPEEVTDMRRSTTGEVVAATFDRPPEEHIALAELTIERAKRLVEEGKDVVIVLDGITRLARAYNLGAPTTGRVMSGGIDTGALYPPKKFFGAARNVEEGGSLTILATALVETGSRMDEVIFEEFKGTGNMELRLDRRLAERRIYPAIDVDGSSTRHEELLFDRKQLQQVWKIRRALHALGAESGSPAAALERLLDGMKQYKTNADFLDASSKG
jgi:transcription termination factor Rho